MINPMRGAIASTAFSCLLAAACRGSSPAIGHDAEHGLASVVIGSRIVLPTGETRSGRAWMNLEGEGDHGDGERYRLKLVPGLPMLYQVEPDNYHLAPTRSIFSSQQPMMKIRLYDRTFLATFPRDVVRKAAIKIKSGKIVSLGILEIRVSATLPGRDPVINVFFDDTVAARRRLVEQAIHSMMDPEAPFAYRENAVAWMKALDMTLVDLSAESEAAPLYKRASP
jgi:hypothetical protein